MMINFRDVELHGLIMNSRLWKNINIDGGQALQLVNSTENDMVGGEAALFKERYHN